MHAACVVGRGYFGEACVGGEGRLTRNGVLLVLIADHGLLVARNEFHELKKVDAARVVVVCKHECARK